VPLFIPAELEFSYGFEPGFLFFRRELLKAGESDFGSTDRF